jgi:hypothetical protein
MGLFHWLEKWFTGSTRTTGINDASNPELSRLTQPNRDQQGTGDTLMVVGTGLRQLSGVLARQAGQAASATYQQVSNIDYSFYANQGCRALVRTAVYLNASVESACNTAGRMYDAYQNVDYHPTQVKKSDQEPIREEDFSKDFDLICPICMEREKNRVVFPCGHTFCQQCLSALSDCPNCRTAINGQMKFFL